jgi:epoxyqueuosine reductase
MPEWCLPFGIVQPADISDLERYTESVLGLGRQAGLRFLSVAPAAVMERARGVLESRKRAGLHDTMQFTYRNPERSTDPTRAVRGARAIIVAALDYGADTPANPAGAHGLVAQYARTDHYGDLTRALQVMRDKLRGDGFRAVEFVDDNSMVDREAAWLGGLGWFGKNANLLLRGSGSLFVLGSVVTSAPLKVVRAIEPDGCGSCRVCIDACPTGAIVADGVVDARRCLSWLLQKPGVFPREFRVALGERLYGCDECQETCPENVRLLPARPQSAVAATWLPVLDILEESDEALNDRVSRWYVPDRDVAVVRRNALVVLGNLVTADPRVSGVLRRYLAHDDEVLRAQAVWTTHRLGLDELLPDSDPSGVVVEELQHARGVAHL